MLYVFKFLCNLFHKFMFREMLRKVQADLFREMLRKVQTDLFREMLRKVMSTSCVPVQIMIAVTEAPMDTLTCREVDSPTQSGGKV